MVGRGALRTTAVLRSFDSHHNFTAHPNNQFLGFFRNPRIQQSSFASKRPLSTSFFSLATTTPTISGRSLYLLRVNNCRIHWKSSSPHTIHPLLGRCFASKNYNNDEDGNDSDIPFVVSILGPPNAGKSTLFNRLQCKQRNQTFKLRADKAKGRLKSHASSQGQAIVSPVANTTRDRRECWGRIGGTTFRLMDTAGIDGPRLQTLAHHNKRKNPSLEQAMMEQTLQGARQSDLILLLWDAKLGVTQDLVETARWLRKLDTAVQLIANKLEGDAWVHREDSPVLEHLNDATRLGLGEAIPISALQGDGMADIAILIEQLKQEKRQQLIDELDDDDNGNDFYDHYVTEDDNAAGKNDENKPLQVAIIGRQNVGKSTLVNTLLQSNRVLTGPTPGLTRDAIAVQWKLEDGQVVQLVDTAGIRKLTKRMDDPIEDMSVADSLRAMKVAQVAVVVLDAEALFIQRLELALCNAVIEEGRALVIAANKMDLLEMSAEYTPNDFQEAVREQLESRIPMLRKTPIVPMSCLTGEGVDELLPAVVDARNRWARTFPTGVLNRWLREVVDGTRTMPVVEGVRAKLKYIIQTKGRPPTFILFGNVTELPDTFLRYLTKNFQDTFELFGMPVRLLVQKSAKKNPYSSSIQRKRSGFGLGGREARMQRRVKGYQETKKRREKKNQ